MCEDGGVSFVRIGLEVDPEAFGTERCRAVYRQLREVFLTVDGIFSQPLHVVCKTRIGDRIWRLLSVACDVVCSGRSDRRFSRTVFFLHFAGWEPHISRKQISFTLHFISSTARIVMIFSTELWTDSWVWIYFRSTLTHYELNCIFFHMKYYIVLITNEIHSSYNQFFPQFFVCSTCFERI